MARDGRLAGPQSSCSRSSGGLERLHDAVQEGEPPDWFQRRPRADTRLRVERGVQGFLLCRTFWVWRPCKQHLCWVSFCPSSPFSPPQPVSASFEFYRNLAILFSVFCPLGASGDRRGFGPSSFLFWPSLDCGVSGLCVSAAGFPT